MEKPAGSSEFFKNVLTLVSGTGMAQALTLLATPVLSRLFTPEEFAPYTLFMACVGILAVAATGRFELAILLPKKENEARSLVALSFIVSAITAALTLLGVVLYDVWLYRYWPNGNFNAWFYLLPPTIFIMGAYRASNYWSTRNKTYRKNASGRIVTSFLMATLGIMFGFFHFPAGLIIAFLLGNVFGLIMLSHEMLNRSKKFFAEVNKTSIRSVLSTHSEFAKVNLPHALLHNFQEHGIIFFIAYFFNEALIGLYGLSFRVLKGPLGLIGDAYYQVFYQKITQHDYSAAETRKMVLVIFRNTFLMGIVPFSALFFFGPELFAWIFGESWREAGVISQILTPWLFLNFMASPVSCVPLKYNRLRGAFLITIIDVIFKYTALIYGGLQKDYYLAFTLLSIFESLLMLFGMWWYLHIIAKSEVETDATA